MLNISQSDRGEERHVSRYVSVLKQLVLASLWMRANVVRVHGSCFDAPLLQHKHGAQKSLFTTGMHRSRREYSYQRSSETAHP